ncbi:pectate lyase superfamily protein-domain-containing protein [Neohortaea acidophila]|uniref:Pectate lyase superfamily protein-domain-containing protein n=1 Tax=Neohortaea acidophila TaxID=245834 RepID=A0A6A6PLC9_9PEZI|nr:pectate lyase superfamily protein-domain-containing protein [Neohortaea acidophila]KAF2480880.1 pectate lyase superfamily protein-domain-containing protein [Neohortaea acidophila]
MSSIRSLLLLCAALGPSLVVAVPAPQIPTTVTSATLAETASQPTFTTSTSTLSTTSSTLSTPSSAWSGASQSGTSSSGTSTSSASHTILKPGIHTSSPGGSGSNYWYANIDHSLDTVWQNSDSSYQVFRNVMSYGAKGDGVTDDTAAINAAISAGNRCGGLPSFPSCQSSTITPAVVFFPPGTYLVSTPIQMFYMTQMIGDPTDLPTLLASSDFQGMAVVDSDPYIPNGGGANWFVNQNNFYRQVRNFVIDITQWNGGMNGAAIHWQVAQATSLQNIIFELSPNEGTTQQGVFMDNGSGGWFADLTFNNGDQGAFLGSQQFTSRNLTFNNCKTAIYLNWDWGWTLAGITVNGGSIGLDMSNDPTNQTVGSVVLADSTFSNVEYGVKFSYQNSSANVYPTGGTLIMDNVDMSGVRTAAVVDNSGTTILEPGMIAAWASGNGYSNTGYSGRGTQTVLQPTRQENTITPATKASSLLDGQGNIFGQSRPQYETYPVTSFLSAKQNGCAGDGVTDDTAAVTALLQKVAGTNNIAYFEHGAYLIKDTVTIPPNVMMTGEIWPLIVADSASFSDESAPKPVFQVGQSGGQQGFFQISDFIFETNGPAPGAVLIEWNLQSAQGESGMWDVHTRVGGSAGSNLEVAQCAAVNGTSAINTACEGVFLMFHATSAASGVYLENTWFWVADHDLDSSTPEQLTIYSGRGMLIQAAGPVWLWGTASEHSIMYNYQFDGVQALYSGLMQSETPYFQPFPEAPAPLTINSAYGDPTFSVCAGSASEYCKESWGLRVINSRNVLIYTTGLYSFYQDYAQECAADRNCQLNMIHIQNSQVDMYAVNTFSAVNMLLDDGVGTVTDADNANWFCATLAYYFTGH